MSDPHARESCIDLDAHLRAAGLDVVSVGVADDRLIVYVATKRAGLSVIDMLVTEDGLRWAGFPVAVVQTGRVKPAGST